MSESKEASNRITIGTLTDECYKRIKYDILVGNLGWGERLNVIAMAEQYGISRSPVIKAIDRLAMEQLVLIVPNIGSFVRIPTKEDVQEVSEIRRMLETTMCRLAYRKNKDLLLAELHATDEAIRRPAMMGNKIKFESFLEYDRSFHMLFARFSANDRLTAYYESNRSQVELFRTHTYYDSYVELALGRHSEIVTLLVAGQLDDAVAILETHISEVEAEVIESIEKNGAAKEYK